MRVETIRPAGEGAWTAGLVGVNSERFRNVTMPSSDPEQLTIVSPASPLPGIQRERDDFARQLVFGKPISSSPRISRSS